MFNFILVLRGSVAALKSLVACTLIFFLFLSLFGFVCTSGCMQKKIKTSSKVLKLGAGCNEGSV